MHIPIQFYLSGYNKVPLPFPLHCLPFPICNNEGMVYFAVQNQRAGKAISDNASAQICIKGTIICAILNYAISLQPLTSRQHPQAAVEVWEDVPLPPLVLSLEGSRKQLTSFEMKMIVGD